MDERLRRLERAAGRTLGDDDPAARFRLMAEEARAGRCDAAVRALTSAWLWSEGGERAARRWLLRLCLLGVLRDGEKLHFAWGARQSDEDLSVGRVLAVATDGVVTVGWRVRSPRRGGSANRGSPAVAWPELRPWTASSRCLASGLATSPLDDRSPSGYRTFAGTTEARGSLPDRLRAWALAAVQAREVGRVALPSSAAALLLDALDPVRAVRSYPGSVRFFAGELHVRRTPRCRPLGPAAPYLYPEPRCVLPRGHAGAHRFDPDEGGGA